MTPWRVVASAAALSAAASMACGAPPWRLGAPLDGRPSIPPTTARPKVEQSRAAAVSAQKQGRLVVEIEALMQIAVAGDLTDPERARLFDLLVARAAVFRGRGRAIPESRDLETAAGLDGARAAALAGERAVAAAAAGDAWKAIGARDEARAAYALASTLGGAPPLRTPAAAAPPAIPAPDRLPPDFEGWLLRSPVLAVRLLPLAAAFPQILDDQPRALRWAELLLAEDPTSPDSLELVAFIFGRANRRGGTERMLMELTYHSPDRAVGFARGAVVWERLGRPREACAQWIRAARWRDDSEDPSWRRALACARNDPGAGDWRAIRNYVVARAKAERRETIGAELDALLAPPDAGLGDAGSTADAGVDAGAPAPGGSGSVSLP